LTLRNPYPPGVGAAVTPLAVGVCVEVIELEMVIEGVRLNDMVEDVVEVAVGDEVIVAELVNVKLEVCEDVNV
jgi:hypothetical protein